MNKTPFVPFSVGIIVGAMLFSTAYAAGLVPAWRSSAVTPVVFVTYNSLYGFVPVGSNSPLDPSWRKEQVVAITTTSYHSLYGFIPIKSDTQPMLGPSWKAEQVTPWTEVVYDGTGQFVTKNSD